MVLIGEFRERVAQAVREAGFSGDVVTGESLSATEAELRTRVRAGDAVLLKASRLDRLEGLVPLMRQAWNEKGVNL